MLKLSDKEAAGLRETLWEAFKAAQQIEDFDLVLDLNRYIMLLDPVERSVQGRDG